MPSYILDCRPKPIELGKTTKIMGIVNVTPDSFSDGGDFYQTDNAIRHGIMLYEQGADILDIGGESTRPFSEEITIDEELRRVIPVIEGLSKKVPIPISIDTTKSAIAYQAIDAGATMVNDISSFRTDAAMAEVVAKYDVPVILMHMKGTPKTMQIDPVYEDLMGEICAFLTEIMELAVQKGIKKTKLVIDPGIGFGKTFADNLVVLNNLHLFHDLGVPLLVGSSRKKFIRNLLSESGEEDIDPKSAQVETGTQATVTAAVLNGAHIVRVHDVASTKATVKIADAIKNSPKFLRHSS